MKYSIKPTNDSDKENARQLELIMNHKFAAYDDISEVRKERVDNFGFKKLCIVDCHEALISETESEIINFDQIVNDEISKKILESGLHKSIESLTEFGMAASHVSYDNNRGISIKSINPMNIHAVMMPSIIRGLNHNIMILDDIEIKEPDFENEYFPINNINIEFADEILFQKQKQPKENHPHGWYRKFDKKRY